MGLRLTWETFLLDIFGYLCVFFWVFGKMDEINKYGQKSRSMPRRGEVCPCLGEVEARIFQHSGPLRRRCSSAMPRRSHCSQHVFFLCFVSFCYSVIPRTHLMD